MLQVRANHRRKPRSEPANGELAMSPVRSLSPPLRPELKVQVDKVMFDQRITAPGREYVEECISQGPARQAQGRLGNAITRFVSRKTGLCLLLESRRGEFALAVLLDNDPDVIAFFTQPPTVQLDILGEDGKRRTTTRYTPDFLVVRKNGIFVMETRDEGRLLDALANDSSQFARSEVGEWRFLPAESRFSKLGFGYKLIANSSLPARLVENTRFLEDYARVHAPALDPLVCAALKDAVAAQGSVALHELLGRGFKADDIYRAILAHEVHIDWGADRLANSAELVIHADATRRTVHQLLMEARRGPALELPGTIWLKADSTFEFGGHKFTVLIPGETFVLACRDGAAPQRFDVSTLLKAQAQGLLKADGLRPKVEADKIASHSKESLERAAARLRSVRSNDTTEFSARSHSRYRKLIASATSNLDALLALVDRQNQRGNRTPRFSEANGELIEQAYREFYNTPDCRTVMGTYAKYQELCANTLEFGEPVRPVAYTTFCRMEDDLGSTLERRGRRAAYQARPIRPEPEFEFPVNGVRPHEVCFIDHTIANLATVSPEGVKLGKPTLTIGVDGHTAKSRALILSYDPPSSQTVLMVLRDYVRRHNRLPKSIVVDNGKEFHSDTLIKFCALYGVNIHYRTPGQPRERGSMIERLLGATETEVLSEMTGNTRLMIKDTRLVTKAVDPFRRAEWTLVAAYYAIENYLFDVRANRVHPAIGRTPNDYEAQRLAETGARDFLAVQLDENFLLMTSPHAKRPYHKVDPQRGVWVNGPWYRHPDMQKLGKGHRLEVRIEPWNASVVYVYLNQRWVTAVGVNSRWLTERTQREVEIMLREQQRLSKLRAQQDRLTEDRQAFRANRWRPEHFDARLNVQQLEMKTLYDNLGISEAMRPSTPDDARTLEADGGATAVITAMPVPAKDASGGDAASPETANELEAIGDGQAASGRSNLFAGLQNFR
ncbi:DDE-type integrase/transposase/recombinase [Ideonella azotifigens]|nr:DDE-type integrase/transposase/recombinase [Ideonella azotifigens]MCD2343776.1 DDE-type integrase/transposase/recombinase [Ideonella azotifigens]